LLPDFGSKDGLAEYDVDVALQGLRTAETRLTELNPKTTVAAAGRLHEHAIGLVAVVISLVGALFLLTVAQLGGGRIRMTFGTLGIVAAIVATAAFVVVEAGVG
jgi:hypothetical protein